MPVVLGGRTKDLGKVSGCVGDAHRNRDGGYGDREKIVVLPVEARQGHLGPSCDGPGGREPSRGSRSGCEEEVGDRGNRRQPKRPARGGPPDEVVGSSERPGEASLRVGVAGDPAMNRRRGTGLGEGIGCEGSAVVEDVVDGVLGSAWAARMVPASAAIENAPRAKTMMSMILRAAWDDDARDSPLAPPSKGGKWGSGMGAGSGRLGTMTRRGSPWPPLLKGGKWGSGTGPGSGRLGMMASGVHPPWPPLLKRGTRGRDLGAGGLG